MQKRAQKYLNFAILVWLMFSFLPASLQAQRIQRFRGGAVLGLTASQVDGDASAGFHKVGLQGGLRVVAALKKRQTASIEFLYTQRGCRNEIEIPPYFSTTLHYVEVPVQWHFNDWLIEGSGRQSDYYRVQVNAGFVYGRLVSATDKFNEGGIINAFPYLRNNSVAVTLGATYFFNRHLGLCVRWNRAITALYRPGDGGNYDRALRERFLVFQLNYML